MSSLYPFQEVGVAFLKRSRRAYLADEMGLGKTVQAIVAARQIRPEHTVVVCPASVVENWKREWEAWGGPGKLYVISYSRLARNPRPGQFTGISADIVILDEAHYCKTPSAQRTKAALKLAANASHAWLLSGTPMPNDPRELWAPVKYLWPELFPEITTAFQWMDRWCVWSQSDYGYRVHGLKPAARTELIPKLREVMLRRKLSDVAMDLPPLRTTVEWLPKDAGLADALDSLTGERDDPEHLSTLRRILGEYKAEPIARQLVEELRADPERKVVVLYHHRATGALLDRIFRAAWLGVTGFDGSTPPPERQRAIDEFQNNAGLPRVFLAQQTAAGLGITVTAASDIVLVEPSWSPEDNKQAIKRIHRIGQDKPCRARLFAVPGSMDASLMGTLVTKTKMIQEVVG